MLRRKSKFAIYRYLTPFGCLSISLCNKRIQTSVSEPQALGIMKQLCFIFIVFIFSYYLWEGKTDSSFEVMLNVSFLKIISSKIRAVRRIVLQILRNAQFIHHHCDQDREQLCSPRPHSLVLSIYSQFQPHTWQPLAYSTSLL